MHVLPQHEKETIKHFAENLNKLYIQDHHLSKCNTIYSLEKLSSRELYQMQLLLKYENSTCHDYQEKNFNKYNFSWKLINSIPHIAEYETKICIF